MSRDTRLYGLHGVGKITEGRFDWVGGTDMENVYGLHSVTEWNDLNIAPQVGDVITIQVDAGKDERFNGSFEVLANSIHGDYDASMITIKVPGVTGTVDVSGTFKINSEAAPGKSLSPVTKKLLSIGILTTAALGLIYKDNIKKYLKK